MLSIKDEEEDFDIIIITFNYIYPLLTNKSTYFMERDLKKYNKIIHFLMFLRNGFI